MRKLPRIYFDLSPTLITGEKSLFFFVFF